MVSIVKSKMSAPPENVLIVPSRNVLLTRSGWEGGRTRVPHHGQRERARLVVLKKVQKKLITQRPAAVERQLSERQVRRLLVRRREVGDRAVGHGLCQRPWNRRLREDTWESHGDFVAGDVSRVRTDASQRIPGRETQN